MTCMALVIVVCVLAMASMGMSADGVAATGAAMITVKDSTPLGEAFEKGLLARDVQLDPNGAVMLYDLTLAEDDGPGATAVHDFGPAAPTTIRGDVQVRKVLHLDRAEALAARVVLCVGPMGGEKSPLTVTVNGRRFSIRPAAAKPANDWPTVQIPLNLLRPGDNEVVLSCPGEKGWLITVAQRKNILLNDPSRKDRPNRSSRSTDGGQTWAAGLGDDGSQDGELMVRLHLGQHAGRGEIIGPVIDLAALAAQAIDPNGLPGDIRVRSVGLRTEKRIREGTGIEFAVRCGDMPVYEANAWGEWLPCSIYGNVQGDLKRFVQWRAVLATEKPKATPLLESVAVIAEVQPRRTEWAYKVNVLGSRNEEIRYTSMPFEYEKFDEPGLAELRAKYKLDEVVAGAKTEIEKMIRLRNWVHAQWTYDPPVPEYPAWDAREILQKKKGFCVQFAIVNMQCALSLGMQARFVFGHFPNVTLQGRQVSGHEVTEVWSNDLGKWVMMDAQRDESFVDRKTGVLTGMLNLHEEQLNTYYPQGIDPAGFAFDAGRPSETLLWQKGADAASRQEDPVLDIKWGHMQYVPRNNFYAHRYPEPLLQGRTWSWTGYWNWEDARSPREWRFGRYTRRHSDIEWTINQVRWAASPAEQPGALRIVMGTVTPDFDTYLVRIDSGEWIPSPDVFTWSLHPGKNRLEMRVRNRAGVLGRVSFLEVEYS